MEQGGICTICKEPLDIATIYDSNLVNVDHHRPKAKRGTNARSNKKLTHKPCNDRKADTMPSDVIDDMDELGIE